MVGLLWGMGWDLVLLSGPRAGRWQEVLGGVGGSPSSRDGIPSSGGQLSVLTLSGLMVGRLGTGKALCWTGVRGQSRTQGGHWTRTQ